MSLRLLHTSDWHLGQKFLSCDREEEHQLALDWLRNAIIEHQVDVLVVAGDIFDISNPPNTARKLYYRFLASLLGTPCRHIVITAGNHDSPAMIEAPKDILQALNVHVVGAAGDELLDLKNDEGQAEALIAAVPFLRERDLRFSAIGESAEQRLLRLREAIKTHYHTLALEIRSRSAGVPSAPVIATGHLYAYGSDASGKQDNIYLGDTENIHADDFPEIFSYVALGHIHRAQTVGGKEHIRYAGSLIPLSFSETKDEKGAYLVLYEGAALEEIRFLPCPTFRRLKTIEGDLENVKKRLTDLNSHYPHPDSLESWVEAIVHLPAPDPALDQDLHDFTKDLNLQLLKIRILLPENDQNQTTSGQIALEDLTPEDVFLRRCLAAGYTAEDASPLLETFRELLQGGDFLAE